LALRDIFAHFGITVDQRPLVEAQKNVQSLIGQFNGLARIAAFALGALGVGKITDAADEYINLENKLKAVTTSTADFLSAQKGVEKIADDLMQPVADIADGFLRYSLATESLGASQEEVLNFTKRVTQAMILSGATSAEAHRAAVQLAQGFGKNFKAAAQDLKSVKEQAPVLARIIEKAAGGVPGSLLVMAKEGKITSKLVFDAVRADGEQLDRDFAKRQKTFENMANLLGNQWLQLIKKLKPILVPILDALESIVHWIKEWVDDGSVLNAVIAGAITAVGTLTYFFGGLALSVAATLAPFAALFLVLDELVAFIRGDESYTEDLLTAWLGKNQVERFRAGLNELTDLVKQFFAALGNGPEAEMAAWRFERAMKNAVDRVWAYAEEKFIAWARRTTGVNPTGPQAKPIDPETGKPKNDSEVMAWFAEVTGFKDEIYAARRAAGIDPETGKPLGVAGGGMVGDDVAIAPTWSAEPPPVYRSPYGSANTSGAGAGAAPVINNTITVQGNADAPVAREIANRTGNAVAEILGRDRSAVGAGFGLQP
jgi:tape measure domain-containing protein